MSNWLPLVSSWSSLWAFLTWKLQCIKLSKIYFVYKISLVENIVVGSSRKIMNKVESRYNSDSEKTLKLKIPFEGYFSLKKSLRHLDK